MYVLFNMTKQSVLSLIVVGIFIALLIKIGTGLRKYNEMVAVVILCGSLSAIALLYLQRHPETIDALEDHPTLTIIGICVSSVLLVYHLLKKSKDK